LPDNLLTSLRVALAERIAPIFDFDVTPEVPDQVNPPCAWIDVDRSKPADYTLAFGGRWAAWKFKVTVLASPTIIESAQDAIDQYLDPRGALITALHDDLDDALQTLANGNVQVLNAAAYSGYPMGDVTYMGAQLIVQVRA